MRARIYQPAKTAMQSGQAKTHNWVLDYAQGSAREVDPLMGWTSSSDTQTQVRLRFATKEEALAYAQRALAGRQKVMGADHRDVQSAELLVKEIRDGVVER